MSQKKKSSNSSSGFTLALWIVAALVLFIIFILNWGKIASNLKETGFFGKIFGTTPEFIEKVEVTPENIEKNDVEPIAPVEINLNHTGQSSSETGITSQNQAASQAEEQANIQRETQSQEAAKTETEVEKPAVTETQPKPQPQPQVEVPRTMNIRLFFMEVSPSGSVVRKEVIRSMKKSDSPLVDSINALIAGPNSEEERNGCRSLISNGTKLLSASIKNGVATLNFSAEFEFNQYGIEGTRGQLQQIVFTSTAFPSVDSVQFLIDGEKKEYLGSEGVWIGTPLSRNSF